MITSHWLYVHINISSYTDADADPGNYELSFTLEEGSPFGLLEAVKTDDVLPTYETQLVLKDPLDYNTASSYNLTVTAKVGMDQMQLCDQGVYRRNRASHFERL